LWAKKREQNAAVREAERLANTQRRYKVPDFTPLKPRPSRFVESEEMKQVRSIPSLGPNAKPARSSHVGPDTSDWSNEELAEWRAREAAAQAEVERKKTMVAPLYNKGGYQYVGDAPPEVVKTLGRKV
jgi:hypothetical protein